MDLKEVRERLRFNRPEAGQIYFDQIHPSETVVGVGPSHSVTRDPTSLVASHLVGESGAVFLADPLFTGHEYGLYYKSAGGPLHLDGGVSFLLHQINELRDAGVLLGPVTWLGAESGVFNIPLSDSSAQVVIDHYTSTFLASREYNSQKEKFNLEAFLTNIFHEYRRVLSVGGRVIFQTELVVAPLWGISEKAMGDLVTELMKGEGITGSFQKVEDRFRIPITREAYSRLMLYQISDKYRGTINLAPHLQPGYSSNYLVFEVLYWRSPDLFLGVKEF